ncbi:MAG: two-component regulator propeller domain-containing protein [Candidatus Parabeggiatoa sp.]|nr:two-component regulator propeller domain-containing protein [Candidatus Parabeggiatoa sp.]
MFKFLPKNLSIYLILPFFMGLSPLTQAQTIQFQQLSIKDGLSQSTVYSILQDRLGFLWIGTEDGLNKYDGYRFTVYRHQPQNPHSLSDNTIFALYEDSHGTLWIGTANGLNQFDQKQNQFVRHLYDPHNPNSLSHQVVLSIYEDHRNQLWIGTKGGGLNQFDRIQNHFVRYQHDPNTPNSLSHNVVWPIYEDSSNTLWIGTNGGGLNQFDLQQQKFIHYLPNPKQPDSLSNRVTSIYEDSTKNLWIGTLNGLHKFDRQQETFVHYFPNPDNPNSLSHRAVWDIVEDKQRLLWIATDGGGLNRFDPKTETFKHYKQNPQNPTQLNNDYILSLYQDRAGTLWIGTAGGGLNLLHQAHKPFHHYFHNPLDANTLNNNDISALYEDRDGFLWVGTEGGGLNQFDQTRQNVTHYRHDPQNPNSLSHDDIQSIYQDTQGILWIGTYGGGLNHFNRQQNRFIAYRNNPDNNNTLSDDYVMSIYEDNKGFLWIGTLKGLNRFDRQSHQFVPFCHDPNNPNSLSHDTISAIYQDKKGSLWIGTEEGLNQFNDESNQFVRYQHDLQNPNSLSHKHVSVIHEDKTGTLWVGTYGGGLNQFNRNTKTFRHYHEQHGLPNDTIYGILEDAQGYLWLSTNKGLSKFNPKTGTFRNYDRLDGLQSDEFNPAFHQNRRGELFFGGINGFNVFHPAQIQDNPYKPPIVITQFKIFNQPVPIGNDSPLKQLMNLTKEIKLSYQQSFFSFEFAALNFLRPEKNQYTYKLEGFDQEWNQIGTRRQAYYTNVPPGTYWFNIKGSNNDNIWNEAGRRIKIIITPPWWEKRGFQISLIILLVTMIIGGFHWRVAIIKKQKHQLENCVQERTEELQVAKQKSEIANQAKSTFLASMSHELRTPLNGILGYAHILLRDSDISTGQQQHGLNVIEQSGNHLLDLINDVLDLAKVESGKIELYEIDFNLPSLLNGVSEIIKIRAQHKGIHFYLDSADNLPNGVYGDERRLRQILLNLLGNAIKFTDQGSVTLTCRGEPACSPQTGSPQTGSPQNDFYLYFKIEDTGVGISPENLERIFEPFKQVGEQARQAKGTGLGLAISKNLVELMGGQLRVSSQINVGTQFGFELALPVVNYQIAQVTLQQIIGVKGESPKILVVDDNVDNQAVLVDLLSPLCFNVKPANNGRDGLEKALRWQPDVIITDLIMPEMDGFELIRQLRQSPVLKNKVIIVTSASTYEEDKKKSLAVGSDAFLPKPIPTETLFEQLQQHLNLTWIYSDKTQETGEENQVSQMVLPPIAELEKLYELTLMADIDELKEQTAILAESDVSLKPFITKMQAFLKKYKVDELSEWLEEKMKDD